MAKRGIFYNFVVGLKLFLIGLITQAILIIPVMILMFGSLNFSMMDVTGKSVTLFNPIILLVIPIGWFLNGYFVNKFRNWIFR